MVSAFLFFERRLRPGDDPIGAFTNMRGFLLRW
jgi:hypothetical protein